MMLARVSLCLVISVGMVLAGWRLLDYFADRSAANQLLVRQIAPLPIFTVDMVSEFLWPT